MAATYAHPHLAKPEYAHLTNDEVISATAWAQARFEAVRPNEDMLRVRSIEKTGLEMELVARGISAQAVPVPTQNRVASTIYWSFLDPLAYIAKLREQAATEATCQGCRACEYGAIQPCPSQSPTR